MSSNNTDECVRLNEYKFAPAITQSLTAVTIWPTLTSRQRELIASCREVRDGKYAVVIDRLAGQSERTLKSLERKEVVDEFGRLTVPGIYTALWNQLENDKARKARKQASCGTS